MLVPGSWLRDFAPIDLSTAELVDVFNELGMVVDGVRSVGANIDGVVVARVLETRPHPNADRVQLVDVDAGGGDPLQIVCGAFNFSAGDLVPLAPVGTYLPEVQLQIERRKVRGEWSNGMLCSGRELGLSDDASGIMVLATEVEPGETLRAALGIVSDAVFDLDIGVNRPDAMCMAGVARDVAAKLGIPFALPEPQVNGSGPATSALATVTLEAHDLCPRFTARAITGVTVGPSSELVARRLTLAGMRPINNVVDASNYVMLELGQPSHPYDLSLLPARGLLVRRARVGEVVVTLDDVERRVGDGDDCLICDANGEPVGIGGIMGGAVAEISAATTEVLLEAAYFTPMVIARTSKRLGLRTEASARFERGCDPEGVERASLRYCELLGVGSPANDWIDEGSIAGHRPAVTLRTERTNAVLGTDLAADDVARYLDRIGFEVAPASNGVHHVTVPSFRPDCSTEIDLIEEVGRHHGYSNIARSVPATTQVGGLSRYQRDRRRVRSVLTGMGITEAMGTMLVGPGDHARAGLPEDGLQASNPMVREESILRTSLLPGLLKAVAFNARHRMPDAQLFEVGHVYRRPATPAPLPEEPERLAVALAGGEGAVDAKRTWDSLVSALRLDGVRLAPGEAPGFHPTRTAAVVDAAGELLGHVGEVDPDVTREWDIEGRLGCLEVDLDRLLAGPRLPEEVRPVSRFPSSDIDLAFVVPDSVPAGDVAATLKATAGELLVELRLFDVYRGGQIGEGDRSLAYRLRLCALDRTLTDEEVAAVRTACIDAVEASHAARIRG